MQINAFRIRARPMSAVGADCGGERAPDWALNYFKVMQWEREARPVMRMDYTTARYKPPDYNSWPIREPRNCTFTNLRAQI